MTVLEFRAVDVPRGTELLRDLNPEQVRLILEAARTRRYSAKSVITHQSEPADHLLLLWKGRARCFFETPNGKKLIQIWMTPGHIFGGAALLSRPSVYLVSTEAVRDSVVLVWDGRTIRALARRFPQLLENMLSIAADYVSWYVVALAALTSQTARERLAGVLLGYISSIGQRVASGIELDLTNEDLANSANITPYTTSRILSDWRKAGALQKRRGKIFLASPERFFLRVVQSGPSTFPHMTL
jgi:CRP/FNR family transcriptional regulator, nitrogen oxide reductase regulator